MSKILFHLAFPVTDLAATKQFYVEGLGCELGRESESAVTLGLAGHQLVAQLTSQKLERQQGIYPRHFGLVFTSEKDWQALAERAKAKGLKFYQDLTFFLEDPSHNLLEFKHYAHDTAIFGERDFAEVGDKDEPR